MTALYNLYDSDDPDPIPDGVNAAGYVDGYAAAAWNDRGWSRFPNALRIAVYAFDDADALDVETGDATPDQAGPWVARQRARGLAMPWVYVNRSNGHLVELSLRSSGLDSDQVMLWIATDDGVTTIVDHWIDGSPVTYPVAAVQYLTESTGSGGHYDISVLYATYGPGGGTIGGEDLNADQDAKLTAIFQSIGDGKGSTLFGVLKDGLVASTGDGQGATIFGLLNQIKTQLAGLQPGSSVDLTPVMSALAQLEQRLQSLTLKAE